MKIFYPSYDVNYSNIFSGLTIFEDNKYPENMAQKLSTGSELKKIYYYFDIKRRRKQSFLRLLIYIDRRN